MIEILKKKNFYFYSTGILLLYYLFCIVGLILHRYNITDGLLELILLIPLYFMAMPFKFLLEPLGFWESLQGWWSYEGPSIEGFVLIAILYLSLAVLFDYTVIKKKIKKIMYSKNGQVL